MLDDDILIKCLHWDESQSTTYKKHKDRIAATVYTYCTSN